MITGPQLRAARGLLDWSRNDLARVAKISPETVKNIEAGTFKPNPQTAAAVIDALKVSGIVLTEDEGVRKQKICWRCGEMQ